LTDADLKKFFVLKLAPAQPQIFPSVLVDVDKSCESYFEDVFEPEPIVSQEDMVASLVEIWRELGFEMLVSLEPDFRKMARELRAPEVQSQAVSNFVYAMY
jgi:hypothetical protein